MGQNITLCNNEERSLTKESTDLQLMNNDFMELYTLQEIEKIKKYIFGEVKFWQFDTTKGHTTTIYKNEIVFFWHENQQPKIQFKIKALRRTATAPFSYFNPGSQVIKLEFPPSTDLEEKIYYKSMNYTDFKLKLKELKYQQRQQDELQEMENI